MPESKDVESPPEVLTGHRRDYTPSAQPGSRLPHMFVRVNPLRLEKGSKAALSPWKNYVDVVEFRSSTSNWWDMCSMTNKGAILVRLDEHIAWRTSSGFAGDPRVEMQRVFSAILGVHGSNKQIHG
ncbi:hypothetical protein JHK87_048650 [Glycine soja]|nr:hypothetical protein JHK87_048650 [Glycine soja]